MDSRVINKLIRSEIWPILRELGFTRFDSRNAFAYRGQFINVVNFQSFNAYNADVLGCTTYSFCVNLGVYVLGSPGESLRTRDQSGALTPQEYERQFRTQLRKRGPVDGFARDDIFYIHPDGRSTGLCFDEVRYLLTQQAPEWFALRNDLDHILARMQEIEESVSLAIPDHGLGCSACGSYNWRQLKSTLLLKKHRTSPGTESADAALRSIDLLIGTFLDFPIMNDCSAGEEKYVTGIREAWDGLGEFAPVPTSSGTSINPQNCLVNDTWALPNEDISDPQMQAYPPELVSTRKQIWPVLKSLGFSEFTERLAHRVNEGAVEVVEILPLDPTERKTWDLPPGLFRIGLGVFWPGLGAYGHFRMNRDAAPRPRVAECHISNWLAPRKRTSTAARTAFDSVEDALEALTGSGMDWLALVRDHRSAMRLLDRENWELFWYYPMMRSYGAKESPRRLIYAAYLASQLQMPSESREFLYRAEARLESWSPEHLRPNYRAWLEDVVKGLR